MRLKKLAVSSKIFRSMMLDVPDLIDGQWWSNSDLAQPLIDSTLAAGNGLFRTTLELKRLIEEALKAIAKCWAFLKDLDFSWYVIIPIISEIVGIDRALAFFLWSALFLPVLVVITFLAPDTVTDLLRKAGTRPARTVRIVSGTHAIRHYCDRFGLPRGATTSSSIQFCRANRQAST